MRSDLAAFCVLTLVTSLAFAQVTPEEAAKRLREKQAARAAAATQPTTLTAGEVDDLKREIELLKAENEGLRKQLAEAKATTVASAKPKPRSSKHYTQFEIGMTADDVHQLVKYHPQEYHIIQDAPDKIIVEHLEQVNIRTGGIAMRSEWQKTGTFYMTVKDGVVTELSR